MTLLFVQPTLGRGSRGYWPGRDSQPALLEPRALLSAGLVTRELLVGLQDEVLRSAGTLLRYEQVVLGGEGDSPQVVEGLDRVRIQSNANWDASIDELMSLEHIQRINLVDVKLSEANLRRFELREGWWHKEWR